MSAIAAGWPLHEVRRVTSALEPAIDPSSSEPIAALRPIDIAPMASFAVLLIVIAVVFMQGGPLNIQTFVSTQEMTRVLPDPVWSWITICGTGVAAFALLSPSLVWQPRWYAAAAAASALAGLYSNGLKHLFALPRPPSVLDPTRLHVIGHTLHANTFPSGHSVTAFTLAALLIFASRRPIMTAAWTLPLAMLVALSRIAVGAHWPADLAAGAAGGWVCGALGVVIVTRWRQWNTPVGVRLLGLVSIGIGISLFIVDLGYPQAIALQYVLAVVALASGAIAIARPRLDPMLPFDPPR
jgi:membrane-associated phospholipid phosphatase